MTAVFKKPLSCTRRPFSVSFSSRSPGFFGAAMTLKAVAGIALSAMLTPQVQILPPLRDGGQTHGMV